MADTKSTDEDANLVLPIENLTATSKITSPGTQEFFYQNEFLKINDILDKYQLKYRKDSTWKNKTGYNDSEIIKTFSYDDFKKHTDEETKDEILELHNAQTFSL